MTDDRIAIVGLAARVPGAADVGEFWRNICAGVDSVRRFTPAEVAGAGVDPDEPQWVPAYGHLDGLTDFDATLFAYGDEEAALLDPQHRLFLELAWWALEDAGYDPARSDAQIGVFAGCGANRYLRYHVFGNPVVAGGGLLDEDWDDLLAGGTCDYLPTRVAYALGLTGPAVAVQTACSSSLVAVGQAAQSLLDYRCDLAVAGGVAVVSTRQVGYRHRPGGTLAVDGVCRPYDAAATGQVFGNGGGAVVLKRLADAVSDADHIHAVIAGWAVNNDGANRAGFSVPGVVGQAAVVAEALASAGWDAADVGFVEGHGTGTPMGDAIEVEALTRAFRSAADRPGRCTLGSVKANVGNLDAGAGVVGLIKAALAVRDRVIPPTLHFSAANPELELASGPFTVDPDRRVFEGAPRAAVSSFGLGGTNAHLLLEPGPVRPAAGDATGPETALALSAATPEALRELAGRLAGHLSGTPASPLADVAYTLSVGRRALACRTAVVGRDPAEVAAALAALSTGESGPAVPDGWLDAVSIWLSGGPAPAVTGRRVPLPGYPFQRRRHWIDPYLRVRDGVPR